VSLLWKTFYKWIVFNLTLIKESCWDIRRSIKIKSIYLIIKKIFKLRIINNRVIIVK
jgi:hypothetical protein